MWVNGYKRGNGKENVISRRKIAKSRTEQCARESAYHQQIAEEKLRTMISTQELDDIFSTVLPPVLIDLSPAEPRHVLLEITKPMKNRTNRQPNVRKKHERNPIAEFVSSLTEDSAWLCTFKGALSRQQQLLQIHSTGRLRNGAWMVDVNQETFNEVEKLVAEYIERIEPHPEFTIKSQGTTTFARPDRRKMDLAIEAVANSPLAMLHIKSVYAAIFKRYPHFATLGSSALINWKSGLRHTLCLHWAFRVQLAPPHHYVPKGYYYAFDPQPTLPVPTEVECGVEEEDREPLTREEDDPMLHLAALPPSTSASVCGSECGGGSSPVAKGWCVEEEVLFESPTVIRMVNLSPQLSSQASYSSHTSCWRSQESGYESLH